MTKRDARGTDHVVNLLSFFRGTFPGACKHHSGAATPGLNPTLPPPCVAQTITPNQHDLSSTNLNTGRCTTTATNPISTLRFGCFNLRSFKSCKLYLYRLLTDLDICAVSEHWLHQYDINQLHKFHPDFNCYAMAPQVEEDPIYCAPRYSRGRGGVAIFWRKNIDHLVQKLSSLSNHRVVRIQLSTKYHNLCFLSTYLPTRSGCTDQFKESLDYMDSVLTQMGSDHDTLILGDLNADIGLSGGPYCTSNANEQGSSQYFGPPTSHLSHQPAPATTLTSKGRTYISS